MANASETLNRLVIGFECHTSWEQMTGDGVRRFCGECECKVFDFAQMSPTQIRAHLQASRGKLCARLTRQDGRLVTAGEPQLPPPAPQSVPRYIPALAVGMVAVCLGAGGGLARAAEPAAAASAIGSPVGPAAPKLAPARQEAAASGATLRGRVTTGGLPLAGVTIVVRNRLDGEERSALTGEDGVFLALLAHRGEGSLTLRTFYRTLSA